MQIQFIAAEDLQPWNRNPKKHDYNEIINSILRFGFTAPVLLDESTGRIIAGHGRVESLLKIKADPALMKRLKSAGVQAPKRVQVGPDGEWLVPVVRGLTFESEDEAEAYLIADNRLTELGGWDDDMLLEMLRDIQVKVEDAPFAGTGYTDREVANLIRKADVDRDSGPSVEEKASSFLDAAVKQVVIFFKAEIYDSVIERLQAARAAHGVDNNTDLIIKLLEQDESIREMDDTEITADLVDTESTDEDDQPEED